MAQARILIARPRAEASPKLASRWFTIEEVSTMPAVIDALVNRPPAVCLLAVDLPGLAGLDRLPYLRRLSPRTRIVVLSRNPNEAEELEALRMGARGYCGPVEADVLLKLIEKVGQGEVWAARKTIGALLSEFFEIAPEAPPRDADLLEKHLERLTARERQILLFLGSGASNKEIASALSLSVSTVKAHMSRIFKKLDQPDRVHLALYVSALGPATQRVERE